MSMSLHTPINYIQAFISTNKCLEAIPGKITKADFDSCCDQVFRNGGKTQ
jgi:hypothetical protein